jgi:hypothetical protein
MRKCRLCGSVLRRRAEFCRFCTARQEGAHAVAPEGVFLGPSSPPPWMLPAPPEVASSPTPSGDSTVASFEPTWEAVDQSRANDHAEAFDLQLAEASAPPPAPADEWVFDDPVSRREPNGTDRPAPPGYFPSTAVARVPIDPPVPVLEPASIEPGPAAPDGIEPDGIEPDGIEPDGTVIPNGHHGRNGANGHAARTSTGHGSNGSNGNGTNGHRATNGQTTVASAPPPPPPPPDPNDPLLGFEHFPDAAPVPEVRWG